MKIPWLVKGDIDGFFGLFIDNLLQLMLLKVLCTTVCQFPAALVNERILPAAALSILIGNVFYGWQARRLMASTGRDDVTALPYGINTPSLFAFIFLIMAPIYHRTNDVNLAWQAGLLACLASGVMETIGAFTADWLRRFTPRAALLSALAGIAITFISMTFVFRLFAMPEVGLLPLFLILVTYASRVRMPLGLPGGLIAVAAGIGLAWLLRAFGLTDFAPPAEAYQFGLHPPVPTPTDTMALLFSSEAWNYLAVIIPMGLFNVIGSLQNLESAEAAGDRYETRPSLLANGVGTIAAALFGSPFPTTIYIGHPAWKAMGARSGYSTLNGIVIALLCLVGGVTLVLQVVPIEATVAILLWIGIIITAQAFQEVKKEHAIAVAIGLIPSLAAWAKVLIENSILVAGGFKVSLFDCVEGLKNMDIYIHGVLALNEGFLLTSMILSATLVYIIDRKFRAAAGWLGAAAVGAFFGIVHGYELTPDGVQPRLGLLVQPTFTAMYALGALLMMALHRRESANDASRPDA